MTKSKLHNELDRRLHHISTKDEDVKLTTADDIQDLSDLKRRATKLLERSST
jgi:hypothetical protein